MSGKVFISYRRDDDKASVGRIYDAMRSRFGDEAVFFDLSSIPGGAPWKEKITDSLRTSTVLLVVIGPRWASLLEQRQAHQPDGEEQNDEHIFEIAAAFALGVQVIPVLIDETQMPHPATLPPQIREYLPAANAKRLRNDESWQPMLDRFLTELSSRIGPAFADDRVEKDSAEAVRSQPVLQVGPRDSDADFHEIADAVRAAEPGSIIKVLPGEYLKQVVINKNLKIQVVADNTTMMVGEDRETATLVVNGSPCVLSDAEDATIIGLHIRSTTSAERVGVEVTRGTLCMEACDLATDWPEHFIGIRAGGMSTKLILEGCKVQESEVGIHITDQAAARIQGTEVERSTHHAVVIEQGADPEFKDCDFKGSGRSTVFVTRGGRGSFIDCTVGHTDGPTIESSDGGDPLVRGKVVGGGTGAASTRQVRARIGRFLERTGDEAWVIHAHDRGEGRFVGCDILELKVSTGASPKMEGCRIDQFHALDGGIGQLANCRIDTVTIDRGANPLITSGSKVHPSRGQGIAVTVNKGGRGVIQDSEIVGNDVERRVDDPAVRISGGDLTLERCAISGKEPGTVRIESRGIARIDHCEISTDSRGAAVIIETTAGRVPVLGCTIHGGIEIGVAGSALLESCDIDAPKGYAGVNVASGGLVDIEDTQVHDVAGRGVVVTGVAMMSNCEVRTTGEGAIVVLSDGTLKAVDCKVLESGTSTRQWVGRRLGTLGERVKERTDRLLAPAVAILVATGGTGHFVRCSISEERTAAVEADGTVTFEECTLNNAPYLTRDEPTEAEENAARPT